MARARLSGGQWASRKYNPWGIANVNKLRQGGFLDFFGNPTQQMKNTISATTAQQKTVNKLAKLSMTTRAARAMRGKNFIAQAAPKTAKAWSPWAAASAKLSKTPAVRFTGKWGGRIVSAGEYLMPTTWMRGAPQRAVAAAKFSRGLGMGLTIAGMIGVGVAGAAAGGLAALASMNPFVQTRKIGRGGGRVMVGPGHPTFAGAHGPMSSNNLGTTGLTNALYNTRHKQH